MTYQTDFYDKSPLAYAMYRKSNQGVEVILKHQIQDERFYSDIEFKVLNELINFGPNNLPEFFNNAVLIQKDNLY